MKMSEIRRELEVPGLQIEETREQEGRATPSASVRLRPSTWSVNLSTIPGQETSCILMYS